MTETVLLRKLATYILWFTGSYAIPVGALPTGIVAITVFVVVSIIETVPLLKLLTYILSLAESCAIKEGALNPVIVLTVILHGGSGGGIVWLPAPRKLMLLSLLLLSIRHSKSLLFHPSLLYYLNNN